MTAFSNGHDGQEQYNVLVDLEADSPKLIKSGCCALNIQPQGSGHLTERRGGFGQVTVSTTARPTAMATNAAVSMNRVESILIHAPERRQPIELMIRLPEAIAPAR